MIRILITLALQTAFLCFLGHMAHTDQRMSTFWWVAYFATCAAYLAWATAPRTIKAPVWGWLGKVFAAISRGVEWVWWKTVTGIARLLDNLASILWWVD
jgi:drug/metabolite transporter (DMT)-like permease